MTVDHAGQNVIKKVKQDGQYQDEIKSKTIDIKHCTLRPLQCVHVDGWFGNSQNREDQDDQINDPDGHNNDQNNDQDDHNNDLDDEREYQALY